MKMLNISNRFLCETFLGGTLVCSSEGGRQLVRDILCFKQVVSIHMPSMMSKSIQAYSQKKNPTSTDCILLNTLIKDSSYGRKCQINFITQTSFDYQLREKDYIHRCSSTVTCQMKLVHSQNIELWERVSRSRADQQIARYRRRSLMTRWMPAHQYRYVQEFSWLESLDNMSSYLRWSSCDVSGEDIESS